MAYGTLLLIITPWKLFRLCPPRFRDPRDLEMYLLSTSKPGLVKYYATPPGFSDHEAIIVDSDLRPEFTKKTRYTRTLKQTGLPSGKKWTISLEDTSSHYRPSLLVKAGQYLKPNSSRPSTSRSSRKWPVPDNISPGSPQRSEESDKEETEAVQQG